MSLPPAEFFWKILAKSVLSCSQNRVGGKKAFAYPQLKIKLKKKRQKNSCSCAEEIPVSLCCETGPDSFGEDFEPGIRVLLVADATKMHLPHAKSRGSELRAVCVRYPQHVQGASHSRNCSAWSTQHCKTSAPQLVWGCLAAGKRWAPSVGASKIHGSLISVVSACVGERLLTSAVCLDFGFFN